MGHVDWRGPQVLDDWKQKLANGMGEIGLRAEQASKRQLYKGHGVISGTLRRSIHCAPPGYGWSAEAKGGGDASGVLVPAVPVGDHLVVSVGTGLEYALPVHDGHGRFGGYHYMTKGVEIVKPDALNILKGYVGD